MFRLADLLATQVAPTAAPLGTGQPWLLRPRLFRFVTSPNRGYANRLNWATDGRGTFTHQDSQPCRLLPERRASAAAGSGSVASPVGRRLHCNLLPVRTGLWFAYSSSSLQAGVSPLYKTSGSISAPLSSTIVPMRRSTFMARNTRRSLRIGSKMGPWRYGLRSMYFVVLSVNSRRAWNSSRGTDLPPYNTSSRYVRVNRISTGGRMKHKRFTEVVA
jgi:hypothetical protein